MRHLFGSHVERPLLRVASVSFCFALWLALGLPSGLSHLAVPILYPELTSAPIPSGRTTQCLACPPNYLVPALVNSFWRKRRLSHGQGSPPSSFRRKWYCRSHRSYYWGHLAKPLPKWCSDITNALQLKCAPSPLWARRGTKHIMRSLLGGPAALLMRRSADAGAGVARRAGPLMRLINYNGNPL